MKLFIYTIYFESRVETIEYIYEKTVIYKDYSFKKYMLDPLIYLEELYSPKMFFYSLKRLKTNELMKIKKKYIKLLLVEK